MSGVVRVETIARADTRAVAESSDVDIRAGADRTNPRVDRGIERRPASAVRPNRKAQKLHLRVRRADAGREGAVFLREPRRARPETDVVRAELDDRDVELARDRSIHPVADRHAAFRVDGLDDPRAAGAEPARDEGDVPALPLRGSGPDAHGVPEERDVIPRPPLPDDNLRQATRALRSRVNESARNGRGRARELDRADSEARE